MRSRCCIWIALFLVLSLALDGSLRATVFLEPPDTTTQSFWRTNAALEGDGEYGTDGYIVYGLLAPDSEWVQPYNTALTNPDSLVSLPAYISNIELAANNSGRWSGSGNFGQIEDPADDNTLTNAPVIAWGSDPYVFTITRASSEAFRFTIIYATGDGQTPTWTTTVDDGTGPVTNAITALASPNIVYLTFDINSGSDPISVSIAADTVDGWITGFAFDPFRGTPSSNPVPEDDPDGSGAKVDVDGVILSWDTGLDTNGQLNSSIRKHYLYANFAAPAEPNLYFVAEIDAGTPTQPNASYGPIDLERDQVYIWQIEEAIDNGLGGVYGPGDPNNIIGPVWTFYSAFSVPELDKDLPADQLVDEGGDALFIVDAINPFTGNSDGLTYQWYRNGEMLTGQMSDILTVSGVLGHDEGEYLCQVTIADPPTGAVSNSRVAILRLKKIIANWPLNGDPNDVSINGYDGRELGGVGYGEGILSGTQALDCDGIDDFINCGNVPVMQTGAMSISFWVKPRAIGQDWKGMVSKWGPDRNTFWIGQHATDGMMNYSIYLPGETRNTPANVLVNNEWVHFVCTYDGHYQQTYVDGLLAVRSDELNTPLPINEGDLMIGQVPAGNNFFNGLIDDVRIYNYVLTPEEAADLYVQVMGPQCVVRPMYDISGPDGIPDCKVDLIDFAQIAEEWMACGLYPTCITDIP